MLENRIVPAWSFVAPMPTPRSGLAAVLGADGRIYAIGGQNASGTPLATVEAYTPASNSWATVTSLTVARSGLAAAEGSDGRIYAIGGMSAAGLTNVVEAYNPKTNSWITVASLPTPRSGLAAAAGGGSIYAIGGSNATGTPLATVEAYNPRTNSWSTVTSLFQTLTGLAAATGSDGRIYAFGGMTSTGLSSLVEAYTPGKSWNQAALLPTPRSGLAAIATSDGGSMIYAVGGAGANGTALNTVEAYTVKSNSWATITGLITPTSELAGASAGSNLYAFGGTSGTTPLSQVEALAVSSPAPGKTTTTTTVTSSANPSAPGQSVTFTAMVNVPPPGNGTPTGTVNFLDGSTSIGSGSLNGSGVAASPADMLAAGTHTITASYSGDSTFAASSGTLSQTVGMGNTAFVMQIYLDLLGRAVDPSGLSTFTTALNQGATPLQVVQAIVSSQEYRIDVVESLYMQYLGRPADPFGLVPAVQFLESGGTNEAMAATIIGSAEFYNKAGGTDQGFLTALYQDALHRPIDPSGQAAFSQALASGTSRTQVAAAVLSSTEYRQNLVEGYYVSYLRRPADPGGLNTFVNALQSGATDQDVIAAIVSSPEYIQRLTPAS
jgi:N-acetylneuraminic acid mutarotase